MTLTINGEDLEVSDDFTLNNLLSDLGLAEKPVVIELNREALPPSQFRECPLSDGDQLEIIVIAAGG
ncbi:MAG: sulfur carrier protein [Akkermansiaceae bacterium]|jgi:sulfur carrier protein